MKKPADLIIPFSFKDRRAEIIDRMLVLPNFYENHEKFGKISFENIFFNQNPIQIEFCSGNGQWIIDKAKTNPNINWIGVEKCFERARKIWVKMHNMNLSNLFVVYGEAQTFAKYYLKESSIANMFINFPDPWPKTKHAKNRLITLDFLEILCQISKKGSILTIVTDDDDAAFRIINSSLQHPRWSCLFAAPYYQSNLDGYGDSYFHALWQKLGKEIKFMSFKNEKSSSSKIS